MGQSPGETFQVSSPSKVTWMHLIPPVTMCDNMCKALSTQETHPSLGFPDFYFK